MSEIIRAYRVVGKVQGVFFRRSAQMEARRLGLRGYTRNLPDGSVEVIAQGAASAHDDLRLWLKRGPRGARVEAVHENDAAEHDAASLPTDFEIRQ